MPHEVTVGLANLFLTEGWGITQVVEVIGKFI